MKVTKLNMMTMYIKTGSTLCCWSREKGQFTLRPEVLGIYKVTDCWFLWKQCWCFVFGSVFPFKSSLSVLSVFTTKHLFVFAMISLWCVSTFGALHASQITFEAHTQHILSSITYNKCPLYSAPVWWTRTSDEAWNIQPNSRHSD